MTTPISPEAQAALVKLGEAALPMIDEWSDPSRKLSTAECAVYAAGKAYRATQRPADCRPPADAKDGDLFWLVNRAGDAQPWMWRDNCWIEFEDAGSCSQEFMRSQGWTVYGPCTFPGEPIIDQLCDVGDLCVCGDDATRRTCRHFRYFSPTLRPVSDEKIDEIYRGIYGKPPAISDLALVRAVLAFERGTQ